MQWSKLLFFFWHSIIKRSSDLLILNFIVDTVKEGSFPEVNFIQSSCKFLPQCPVTLAVIALST